ncbi:single-stranded-DNA-specific exonuclease RecJ [Candidatus Roizmanbacteria bacterium CG09_land_8_20_14_0_10_41_9]|uniref:Single-stranded-DNA-specific exonuclease RecJ n=1 Tax=Candidatus Roizmanbacteria bacterium CG09_land_8_20_14_0_10_41_9 TaxID=1974850 RepID=A0A2H0WS55_9BACT|nr:MAG: single-stranded-DNA-specific exonuclease RecJ [Candidatus Roizmanbacteria bacterium CG09_land_8_20_14_0_10_41_9]
MKIGWGKEIKQGKTLSDNQIVSLLLKKRGVKNPVEFLNPVHPKQIRLKDFSPFYEKKLQFCFKLLEEIKEKGEMIIVYSDYDADGITGAAILWETLHFLGFNVMPYVPHRKHEGYGFSKKGIDAIKKQYDPRLMISVDHGITAAEKITYAKKLGISVIVTDHHLKPDMLPKDAFAVFHIPQLSGSAVAYFFAKEIFIRFYKKDSLSHKMLETYFQTDYLALATIGTIADMVPLIGPSRNIAWHGLQAFPFVKRYGLKHILREAGIAGRKITPYEIGFMIAPRINAVGRLEHAMDALRLLCTTQEKKAYELASHIGNTNRERQDLVEQSLKEAKKMVESIGKIIPKLIILVSDHWNEGIIGLVASKITEQYGRPTIVMTQVDGFFKGSARSIPSFHITDFLRDQKKYLVDVGGHKQAAGFTIENARVKEFIKVAQKKADKLISKKDLERKIDVDFKLPLSRLSVSLVEKIQTLEPFGVGNPRPVFYSEGTLVDAKIIGKMKNHLKLFVADLDKKRLPMEFVAFSSADQFFSLKKGEKMKLRYTVEVSTWQDKTSITGKIIHFDQLGEKV